MARPVNEGILIRTITKPTNENGILAELPENQQQQEVPNKGAIVSVHTETTQFSIGDYVMFSKHSGIEVELGSEKFLMIKEKDIIAILTEEEL